MGRGRASVLAEHGTRRSCRATADRLHVVDDPLDLEAEPAVPQHLHHAQHVTCVLRRGICLSLDKLHLQPCIKSTLDIQHTASKQPPRYLVADHRGRRCRVLQPAEVGPGPHLGSGRIVALEIEVSIILVNMV